jgi:hypothetical protein
MDEVQSKHLKKGLLNFTQFCDSPVGEHTK